ncbi:uncharacterized protein LOC120535546 isoform X2 [Polypterus senegalus]|uniref:uncharacterized protein LOC120535546 isoform X2 n=1 Tax=Polypterus senegalus TaxID=55291 RepID=UPI0019625B1F|nr:uncharacterized protein LOC120535546 isoform X2 [Polypterus senegalus]
MCEKMHTCEAGKERRNTALAQQMRKCARAMPFLKAWILEFACRHKILQVLKGLPFDMLQDLAKNDILGLRLVVLAFWSMLQNQTLENLHRLLDFLEMIHKQIPDLVSYRHYIKISIGLKAKIILNMFESQKHLLNITNLLNDFFPEEFFLDSLATKRDVQKVKPCHQQFRMLILKMIHDENFRQQYIEFVVSEIEIDSLNEEEMILTELLQNHCIPCILQKFLECIMELENQKDSALNLIRCQENNHISHTTSLKVHLKTVNHASVLSKENENEYCSQCEDVHNRDISESDCSNQSEILRMEDLPQKIDRIGSKVDCQQEGPIMESVEIVDLHSYSKCSDDLFNDSDQQVNSKETFPVSGNTVDKPVLCNQEGETTLEKPLTNVTLKTASASNIASWLGNVPQSVDCEDFEDMDLICLGDANCMYVQYVEELPTNPTSLQLSENIPLTDSETPTAAITSTPVFSVLNMDCSSFEESDENLSPPDPFQSQKQSQFRAHQDKSPPKQNTLEKENRDSGNAETGMPFRTVEGVVELFRAVKKMHPIGLTCPSRSLQKVNNCDNIKHAPDPFCGSNCSNESNTGIIQNIQVHSYGSEVDGIGELCDVRTLPSGNSSLMQNTKWDRSASDDALLVNDVRYERLPSNRQNHLQESINLQPVVLLSRLVFDTPFHGPSTGDKVHSLLTNKTESSCVPDSTTTKYQNCIDENYKFLHRSVTTRTRTFAEKSANVSPVSTSESSFTDLSDAEYKPYACLKVRKKSRLQKRKVKVTYKRQKLTLL